MFIINAIFFTANNAGHRSVIARSSTEVGCLVKVVGCLAANRVLPGSRLDRWGDHAEAFHRQARIAAHERANLAAVQAASGQRSGFQNLIGTDDLRQLAPELYRIVTSRGNSGVRGASREDVTDAVALVAVPAICRWGRNFFPHNCWALHLTPAHVDGRGPQYTLNLITHPPVPVPPRTVTVFVHGRDLLGLGLELQQVPRSGKSSIFSLVRAPLSSVTKIGSLWTTFHGPDTRATTGIFGFRTVGCMCWCSAVLAVVPRRVWGS